MSLTNITPSNMSDTGMPHPKDDVCRDNHAKDEKPGNEGKHGKIFDLPLAWQWDEEKRDGKPREYWAFYPHLGRHFHQCKAATILYRNFAGGDGQSKVRIRSG